LFGAAALLPVAASASPIIYQSATYTGDDDGEYIISADRMIGAVFTLSQTTHITGIGAQFGGYPGGSIFGAIVPVDPKTGFPTGVSSDLAAISLGDVVFSVNLTDTSSSGVPIGDLMEPLSTTLTAGTYAVLFGSGQFGADGFAGLGDYNNPVGNAQLIQGWPDYSAFDDNGIRVVVEGTAVPEPADWSLMIVGFLGLGAMMRRRAFVRAALV
jgi:hypothetical protein